MKSRILYISRKWPPAVGGMETHALELYAGLSEVADVHPLVLAGRKDGRAPGLAAYAMFLMKAMLFCSWHARRFDRVVFGDLILFPAGVIHRCFNRDAVRLVFVFGLDLAYQQRKGILPWIYGIYFRAFRALQSCFARIVAISQHTCDLAQRQGLRKLVVINPCLPASSFPEHDTDARLPTKWEQASGHALRILYFGRLIPRKGALWFAREVMPQLEGPAQFFVVGDSSDEKYKAAIEESARTHRLGRLDRDRLAMMIRQADLVVMPNIAVPEHMDVEGFGLVAVETSALGGRLLAARIDGICDAVVDGVTGTLLPSGDAQAWAQLIKRRQSEGSSVLPDAATASVETRKRYACSIQAQAVMALLDACQETSRTGNRTQ